MIFYERIENQAEDASQPGARSRAGGDNDKRIHPLINPNRSNLPYVLLAEYSLLGPECATDSSNPTTFLLTSLPHLAFHMSFKYVKKPS